MDSPQALCKASTARRHGWVPGKPRSAPRRGIGPSLTLRLAWRAARAPCEPPRGRSRTRRGSVAAGPPPHGINAVIVTVSDGILLGADDGLSWRWRPVAEEPTAGSSPARPAAASSTRSPWNPGTGPRLCGENPGPGLAAARVRQDLPAVSAVGPPARSSRMIVLSTRARRATDCRWAASYDAGPALKEGRGPCGAGMQAHSGVHHA